MDLFLSKRTLTFNVLLILVAFINPAFSQDTSVASHKGTAAIFRLEPPPMPESTGAGASAKILVAFIASETKVREALNQHTFKRDVVLQTIGSKGEVTGEYLRNSQFIFDDRGHRIERVFFHPASTIREMRITKEDIQDLEGSQLLGIDIVEATKYRLTYVGPETVDAQKVFAIDVSPATQPDPNHMKERFFVGRVWIDPTTFQIVKLKGIVEPHGKQRFPMFVTWREQIKDALAFPTRTEADDVLHFSDRDVHYRISVRYYDYKVFAGKVSVKEVDDEAQPPAPESTPTIKKSSDESLPSSKISAFFDPLKMDEGRLLVAAGIDLHFSISDPKELQSFASHELGHGLGLWDCANCKKKRSLINGFPGSSSFPILDERCFSGRSVNK